MQYSIPFAKYSASSFVTSGIVLFLSHLHWILETLVLVLITFEYKLRKVMEMSISVRICHRASLRHDTVITTFRVSWHVTMSHTSSHVVTFHSPPILRSWPSKQTYVQWRHLFAFDPTSKQNASNVYFLKTIFRNDLNKHTKCGVSVQVVEDMRSGWW